MFKDKTELISHQRDDDRCEVLPPQPCDEIDEDKFNQLKCRRGTAIQTEEERWKEVYRILFPGKPIPSACIIRI